MTHFTTSSTRVQAQIDAQFWRLSARLHRGGAYAHVWFKQTKDSLWYPVGCIPPISNVAIRQLDTYCTVSPCGPNVERHRKHKSANADVIAVNCLYADFDAKDFDGSLEAVSTHVLCLPWRPSAAVASGGGLQCYWLSDAPWLCSTPEARGGIALLQKAWVDLVGADDGAKDLARILRIPGTFNHKPEYGTPRPVTFAWCDLDQVYQWGDLMIAAADQLARLTEQHRAHREVSFEHTGAGGKSTLADDDQALIDLAIKEFERIGPKLGRLMAGDITDYGGNESKADLALASLLAYLFGNDETRIRRAMCSSELFRDKWRREDGYLNRTIALAIERSWQTYKPRDPERQAAIAAAQPTGAMEGGAQ